MYGNRFSGTSVRQLHGPDHVAVEVNGGSRKSTTSRWRSRSTRCVLRLEAGANQLRCQLERLPVQSEFHGCEPLLTSGSPDQRVRRPVSRRCRVRTGTRRPRRCLPGPGRKVQRARMITATKRPASHDHRVVQYLPSRSVSSPSPERSSSWSPDYRALARSTRGSAS